MNRNLLVFFGCVIIACCQAFASEDSERVTLINSKGESLTVQVAAVAALGQEKPLFQKTLQGDESVVVSLSKSISRDGKILIRLLINGKWGNWYGRGIYQSGSKLVVDIP